jgi:hypothetical protein
MRMNSLDVGRAGLGAIAGLLGLVLALPAVLLIFPVWLVETLIELIRKMIEPRPVAWEELIEFTPEIGWKPRPHLSAHALDFNQEPYHVTTDASGWRGGGTVAGADVVVFGDSYAFGCGVDDAAFFTDLPGDVRIKAIGSPAYSLVHSLMWMQRLAPELADKLVVWFVYHGNDLADNVHPAFNEYRSPFVRQGDSGDWEIVSDHVDASRWTINEREGGMEAFIDICSDTPQSRRAFEACDFLIQRGCEVCRDAGARLVVMAIPDLSPLARLALARALEKMDARDRFDEETPDRELAAICARVEVPFVALKDHLDSNDYLVRDFHWNPGGHRKVARVISDLYRQGGEKSAPESRSRLAG